MTAVISGSEVELGRDRSLVELHQAGDDAAFTELYVLHYGRLVRFCARLTRDPHAAEEVAQEAFARAFASLDRLNGERRFYPWLTVIARRLVIDRVRDRGRYEFRAEMESGFARAAEDVAVQRMDGDHVAIAFGRLSERHQDVLRLRDWEGLSYDDIAERMGVPSTTVAPLLHRARSALRCEYLGLTRTKLASWLHLAPLIAAARRLRDRIVAWAGHLPDPSIFAAPMAGAVLGATVLLAPHAITERVPTAGHLDAAARTLHASAYQQTAENAAPRRGSSGSHHEAEPTRPIVLPNTGAKLKEAGLHPDDHGLRGLMYSDPDTRKERHEGYRRMPIYYQNEQSGIFIAADPSAIGPSLEYRSQPVRDVLRR